MGKVVIIDKESPELSVLIKQIEISCNHEVILVPSVKAAKEIKKVDIVILPIEQSLKNYSPLGDIPTILIVRGGTVESKPFLLAKRIVDTVDDYSNHNTKYILFLLKRISVINNSKVLICEQEPLSQALLTRTLTTIGVKVLSADSLKKVKSTFQKNRDIKMIMVTSKLSDCRGVDVVKFFRTYFNKLDLPIIALLGENDSDTEEIDFFRAGATDSLIKRMSSQFSLEIFRTKIMQSLREVISYSEMSWLADHDSLTGLYNRRYFFQFGSSLFANYNRGNLAISVAMIDIDDFKKINDTYGHSIGDMVIITIARILVDNTRETDIVARFGGEEFCIILAGTNKDDAYDVLDRIRIQIHETQFTSDKEEFKTSVSIGVSSEVNQSLEDMVKDSDKKLYLAKEGGKDKVIM